jgi:PIN domain nuclease of toxin-antitoxin system
MQIKLQLGKLKLALPLQQLVGDQQQRNGMVVLPIEPTHVFALQRLPTHHNDPFDRLLIAQAFVEDLKLLSVDSVFTAYPVTVLG